MAMPISQRIHKGGALQRQPPNLADYNAACAAFDWDQARKQLAGLPGGRGLNIAHEAVDRHAIGALAKRLALRWISRNDEVRDFSFRSLRDLSNRFANVLAGLGVGRGERVFTVLGRTPELVITALGTLKNGSVFCPLFAAFGPEPIRARLELGQGVVLVTTRALYARKIASIRNQLPGLRHVLLIGEGVQTGESGVADFQALLSAADPDFEIPPTRPEYAALLHFTSGTTGAPKGAVHVHEAVVAHHITGQLALDFHPGDVFWCTADPGWVTGTSYGIIAPLTNGITSIVDEGEFDAERWYRILAEQRVTVWYTAPTAVRMLMRAGPDLARRYKSPDLRFIASVGEPLHAEAVLWGEDAFGLPIHDNWWQTETGGIMIANFAGMDIKPGSMGRPLPGIEAAIVKRQDDTVQILGPGEDGEIALKSGWPSMFRTYLGAEERYRQCFADGWYLTGDYATRDEDGYFWFEGRADDVIKTSGHLVGPFEVERVLLGHPAVAEVGVIGKPDPICFEVVKAFVSLRSGFEPTEALRRDLLALARSQLGAAIAPKEIAFIETMPRTRSGKIMRRVLKARELGLPEGDLSAMEVTA